MPIDCRPCQHYQYCRRPCPATDFLANGNVPQREIQIPTNIIEHTGQQDYNAVLAELIEDNRNRDANRIEAIRTIPDMRMRLIAAAILAHIPQRTIAGLTNHSQSRINQLYQSIKKK